MKITEQEAACEETLSTIGNKKRCPDYDSECIDVLDFKRCYLDFRHLTKATGYCPMIKLL